MTRHLHRICVLAIVAAAGVASACDVPVYRYALERWPASSVDAFFVGGTPPAPLAATPTNLHVHSVSPDALDDAPAWLHESLQDASLPQPRLDVYFSPKGPAQPTDGISMVNPPDDADRRLALRLEVSDDTLRQLADSPLRQEIANRLITGDAAVWVLLDGTDDEVNAGTEMKLNSLLRTIEIAGTPPEVDVEGKHALPPLRFSVIRVARDDADEAIFRQLLLNSEDGLHEIADGPIVFPIFGRGRLLYALAGRGITEQNVTAACEFLIGPCTCEIKDDNPGVDLPFTVDWQGRVVPTIDAEVAPLLTTAFSGTMGTSDASAPTGPLARSDSDTPDLNLGSYPPIHADVPAATISVLPMVVIIGLILACIGVVTVVIMRRSNA